MVNIVDNQYNSNFTMVYGRYSHKNGGLLVENDHRNSGFSH